MNYGEIQQGNNKFKLGSAGTYSICSGTSIYNNIDFVAGTYNLDCPVMNIQGNVEIKNGAIFNVGGDNLKFGHPTLSKTLISKHASTSDGNFIASKTLNVTCSS